MKSLTSNNLIVLSGKVACYCKTFHNDPTLSKSSLNKFDISDLSPTQAGISFEKSKSPFL
jgi:hypothetical protein